MARLVAESEGGGGDGAAATTATTTARPPFMPPWRAALYDAASAARKADPDGYRDDPRSAVVVGAAADAARAWAAAWVAAEQGRK
jgi:hypothetical protein